MGRFFKGLEALNQGIFVILVERGSFSVEPKVCAAVWGFTKIISGVLEMFS